MHGVEAAHQQDLEHVVEALRIRSRQRDERQRLLQVRQQRGTQQRAAGQRPIAVALDGVDLSVVGEITKRMRKAPLRQRVRGKPLVEHHHRGLEARVLQIRVELGEKLRHHHALEDDGGG